MKITPQILSIPPYISTAWKNIASLHVENLNSGAFALIITLHSGARIEIPHLEPAMVETIFAAHAKYMESETKTSPTKPIPSPRSFAEGGQQLLSLEIPLGNALPGMEGFGTLLEHNPEQTEGPDLPPDILEKITLMTQSMGMNNLAGAPKPEPGCNCMRCQIARAMQMGLAGEKEHSEEGEEIVTDEELKFQDWLVKQSDEKLYIVTNPLDEKEQYNVYLGEPVGCTCGEHHCEHARAVLNS